VVAKASGGRFAELTNVPGGAMAVIKPDDPTSGLRLLVHRAGRNTTSTLPVVPGVALCEFFGSDPAVDWPKIVIFGCIGPNKSATWVSEDEGKSWQVYRR
jgi:hypothetical protein